MAERVNTKFVVGLSIGIIAVFALVAATAAKLAIKSAGDHVALGDKRMGEARALATQGKAADAAEAYKQAASAYSRAVNKDQLKLEYIDKWEDALTHYAPESRTSFNEYFAEYMRAIGGRATRLRTDVTAHRKHLDVLSDIAAANSGRAGLNDLLAATDRALEFFATGEPESQGRGEILRRFRGLATVKLMLLEGQDLPPERVEQARQDLEKAQSLEPQDAEVVEGLANWHDWQARQALRRSKPEEAGEHFARERKVIDDFLSANPGSARGQSLRLAYEMAAAQRELSKLSDRQAAVDRANAVFAELGQRLDPLAAALRASAPGEVDLEILRRFAALEGVLDPASKRRRTLELLAWLRESRGSDADVLGMEGEVRAARGEFDQAIDAATRVVALPPRGLGMSAYRQFNTQEMALFLRTQWAYQQWGATPEGGRAPVLARLKEYRDALGATVAADQPGMNFANAMAAFAEGNLPVADRYITTFLDQTREGSPEALMLAAQINLKTGATGMARQRLERVLSLQPGNVNAVYALAQLEMQLQNPGRAALLLEGLALADPGNKDIATLLQNARALSGQGQASDPVTNTLLSASKLVQLNTPEDDAKALTLLQAAIPTHKHDARLVQVAAQLLMRSGKQEEARALIRASAQARPDDETLKQLLAAVEAANPLEARLRVIDLQEGSPLDKFIARHDAYLGAGKQPEAAAALGEAAALEPESIEVLRRQFSAAIVGGNKDQARSIADLVTRKDLDATEGVTFRARLLASDGKPGEAISLVESATSKGTPSSELWRLLGNLRQQVGRHSDAVAAFEKALETKPNDIASTRDLVAALTAQGRLNDALNRARVGMNYAAQDEEFFRTYLALEGEVGDKARALELRQRVAVLAPTDRFNLLDVAKLQIELQRFDEARASIEKLRAEKDDLPVAGLESGYYEARGEPEQARRSFEEFIQRQDPAKLTADPYLALAQLALARGDRPGTIAALEKAREKQDPKRLEGDQALARALARFGDHAGAIAAADRVVRGGADTEDRFFKKLIADAHVRLQQFDQAEGVLGELADRQGADPSILLMRAEIRRLQNDERTARQLLDQAVTTFPDRAAVFAARAQYLMARAGGERDARADLDKAVSLEPNNVTLRRLRSRFFEAQGRVEDALEDLRVALRQNPYQIELLRSVLDGLMMGSQQTEAGVVASEVAENSKENPDVLVEIAACFARAGKSEEAATYLGRAYAKSPTTPIVLSYINSLLASRPPNFNRAQEVLSSVRERVPKEPGLLLAQARLQAARQRRDDAKQSATEALRLIAPKPSPGSELLGWYGVLSQIITDSAEMLPYLEAAERAKLAPDWMRFFRANVMFNDAPQRDAGVRIFEELAGTGQPDAQLRQVSYRALTTSMYTTGQYDKAIAYGRQAVEAFPDDSGFNNDLGYTLAAHADKAEEALPFARKAAELAPGQPEILDTLGWVLHRLGKHQEARDQLDKALAMSMPVRSWVTTLIHAAEACQSLNDLDAARARIEQAKEFVRRYEQQVPGDDRRRVEELDALLRK